MLTTDTPVPQIPDVFAKWLASLKGSDAQAMYAATVAVENPDPFTLAILSAVQGEGNDVYGEGV